MRIAICDNDSKDAITLKELCTSADSDSIHSYSIFTEGAKLCETYYNGAKQFDLLFLDIEMPGMNGIEAGRRIRHYDPDVVIVFTTAYSKYALEAYDCQPLNYILKPCAPEKISAVLNKVNQTLRLNTEYHVIKMKGKSIKLPICDIFYLESFKKHIIYHARSGIYETVGPLSEAYEALRHLGFIQVHQGYIVNMDKIADFDNCHIILENKEKVEMSARKKASTLRAYGEYLERYI